MKKLILILLVLSACVDQDINPNQKQSYQDQSSQDNAKALFGCAYTFQFNISNSSTYVQVQHAVKYNFTIRTDVIAYSNGVPLGGVQPITSVNGAVTYKMWNTGSSIYRYKVTSTGSWVTVNPGATSTFTRQTVIRGNPYDCQNAISVYSFIVYTERVNCGPMNTPSNHFNPIVSINSVSNGHTSDGSLIGVNTSTITCPL